MARPNRINLTGGWQQCPKCPKKFQPGRTHRCALPLQPKRDVETIHTFQKQLNPWQSKFVYLLHCPEHEYYKIGYTDDVITRVKSIQSFLPFTVAPICAWETNDYGKLAHALHVKFENRNIRGEWFRLTQEDVDEFRNFVAHWLENHPSALVLGSSLT
jgi:hypothetical protein